MFYVYIECLNFLVINIKLHFHFASAKIMYNFNQHFRKRKLIKKIEMKNNIFDESINWPFQYQLFRFS